MANLILLAKLVSYDFLNYHKKEARKSYALARDNVGQILLFVRTHLLLIHTMSIDPNIRAVNRTPFYDLTITIPILTRDYLTTSFYVTTLLKNRTNKVIK